MAGHRATSRCASSSHGNASTCSRKQTSRGNMVLQRPVSKRAVLLRTVLAEMTRPIEPGDRKDIQLGKRGPYAGGLGRWPQHLKSLAI